MGRLKFANDRRFNHCAGILDGGEQLPRASTWAGVFLLCAAAESCGGRAAHPAAVETAIDSRLSCAHLKGEYENNLKRLAELGAERKQSNTNNAGLLVTSPLFLDLKVSLEKEAEALKARNERLKALIAEKNCSS